MTDLSSRSSPHVAALIVAAGRGHRAGAGEPKQFRALGGKPVLTRTVAAFANHPQVNSVQLVCHPDDLARVSQMIDAPTVRPPAIGGATRQDSVRAGLEALAAHAPDLVLVHDAARPFLTPAVIDRAIAIMTAHGAAIPVVPVADTAKVVDPAGHVVATPDRASLRLAQTPQAFHFAPLLAAHRRAAAEGRHDFTDDAALAEWAGLTVATFEGDADNMKLTTADDFLRSEARLMAALGDVRTGSGFDVHAFGDGDHVMLCGVRIGHERGLAGHSDADVGIHAIVDAVLGALADGDIGAHFPPSDPAWKGAASAAFLAHACERVRARGGIIAHLDVTLICEAPKVGPHRDAMRARLAEIAGLPVAAISVKATTTERLGFAGRREGIAAMATATVRLPWALASEAMP